MGWAHEMQYAYLASMWEEEKGEEEWNHLLFSNNDDKNIIIGIIY